MTQDPKPTGPLPSPSTRISERDIDEVLLEFDNNPREAIRTLLHDLDVLAQDRDQAVSYGFVRGSVWHRKAGSSPR